MEGEGQVTEGQATEGQQSQHQNVDVEKIKSDAISEYLKGMGYDDESLKGIVAKHKEEEEKNSTELEKVQNQLNKITKELIEEQKARTLAEAKLAALKLGAKPELVDDLVTVAMSRTTKEKGIDAVVAEIKSGTTGSVYFSSGEEEQQNIGKNLTGGTKQTGQRGKEAEKQDDDFIERMKAQRAKSGKSSFWKN